MAQRGEGRPHEASAMHVFKVAGQARTWLSKLTFVMG